MDEDELRAILARGEDSRHQFKREFSNADSLASELAALANGLGGQILIGVSDDGQFVGITPQDIGHLNQLLSNAASQHVRIPLSPSSQNIQTDRGLVLVVNVSPGINKPYMDLQGRFWVKNGADKRHVIEYTRPDKPNSRLQKYRLTELGQARVDRSKNRELKS